MSLVLRPQKSFTVVRQIANHLDSNTYYVRAVIRNAYTDAVIETLDLDDKGSQRFSKNWQVPGDPSGEGFFISIVTSVYTDSNYTSKSANYGDEETTYKVYDDTMRLGGGMSVVDRRFIEDILEDKINAIEMPEMPEIPAYEQPTMRWDEVIEYVKEIPEQRKMVNSLYESIKLLAGAVKRVEKKEYPKPEKVDIEGALEDYKEKIALEVVRSIKIPDVPKPESRTDILDFIMREVDKKIDEIKKEIKAKEVAKPKQIDIRALTS